MYSLRSSLSRRGYENSGTPSQPSTWIALATPTNYLAPQFTATPPGLLPLDVVRLLFGQSQDLSDAGTATSAGAQFNATTFTASPGVVTAGPTYYAASVLLRRDGSGTLAEVARSATITLSFTAYTPQIYANSTALSNSDWRSNS